jgi:hypothetical protein
MSTFDPKWHTGWADAYRGTASWQWRAHEGDTNMQASMATWWPSRRPIRPGPNVPTVLGESALRFSSTAQHFPHYARAWLLVEPAIE